MLIHFKAMLTLIVLAASFSPAGTANAGSIIHDRAAASGLIGPEIRTAIGPEVKTAGGQKCGVIAPEFRTIIDPNFHPGCAIGPDLAPAAH
jgi:hypothetical protein